jgi:hypothetical protein
MVCSERKRDTGIQTPGMKGIAGFGGKSLRFAHVPLALCMSFLHQRVREERARREKEEERDACKGAKRARPPPLSRLAPLRLPLFLFELLPFRGRPPL